MATPSKRTTPRKTAAKKVPAARKASARKQVAGGTKQEQARVLSARKKVSDGAAAVKEAREAAQDMEITSAEEWLADAEVEMGVPTKLRLPSGKVCLAVNKGMMSFVQSGKIPNPLMQIVMGAVNEGKGLPTQGLKDLVTGDKAAEMLAGMVDMVDAVTVECVLKPEIVAVPPPIPSADPAGEPTPGERLPGVLYVDVLDLDDKMFLFNWVVGGTRDIERFREQSAAAMAALQQEGVG